MLNLSAELLYQSDYQTRCSCVTKWLDIILMEGMESLSPVSLWFSLKEMDGKFWRNMVKGDSNESQWLGLETGTWCKWQRMKKVSDTLSTIVIPFIFSKIRLAGSSKQPRHIQGNTFFFWIPTLPLWNNTVSSTDTNLQEKLVFWCSFENSYWSYRAVKEDNCQAQGI